MLELYNSYIFIRERERESLLHKLLRFGSALNLIKHFP